MWCAQAAGAALAKLAKAEKVSSAGLALLAAPSGEDAQQEAAKRLAAGEVFKGPGCCSCCCRDRLAQCML
jgi:hypothetical protein